MSCLKLWLQPYNEEGDEGEKNAYMITNFDSVVLETEKTGM